MSRRHLALPRVWMLTDERQGEAMWDAIDRLPKGAGVIVRHYSLPLADRLAMAERIRRQGHFVAFAGTEAEARQADAQAVYGASRRRGRLPRLYPVHNRAEMRAAEAPAPPSCSSRPSSQPARIQTRGRWVRTTSPASQGPHGHPSSH
jgi:thiamine-phosphate pyrophosphorylase